MQDFACFAVIVVPYVDCLREGGSLNVNGAPRQQVSDILTSNQGPLVAMMIF